MKAKLSPLSLVEFEILKSNFQFNIPKNNEIDIAKLFKSYSVDIEFEHHFDNDGIQVFIQIGVNGLKKPKDGYSLLVEGMGIFEINNPEKVKDVLLQNLKFYSSLNMMINNIRNIMHQQSNLGPLGSYILPPIDIVDLFKKKKKLEASN